MQINSRYTLSIQCHIILDVCKIIKIILREQIVTLDYNPCFEYKNIKTIIQLS